MTSRLLLSDGLADAADALRQGDSARCLALCQQALTTSGRTAATLHLYGSAMIANGDAMAGGAVLQEALALAPDNLAARFDLATMLERQGAIDQAVMVLGHGARHHPGNPDLAQRLASLLSDHGRHADALQVLQAGLRACPQDLTLRGLYAAELAGDLQWDLALRELAVLAKSAPASSVLSVNLGVLEQSCGAFDRAIAHYRQAIALQPDNALAHVNLATALLSVGQIRAGLEEFEWRFSLPTVRSLPSDRPRWRGESLAGRRLLLTAEQGFGDMIQFARFLPLLADRGATVILEVPPPLQRWMAAIPGVDLCVRQGDRLPASDYVTSLLSLPYWLGCDDSAPAQPYPTLPWTRPDRPIDRSRRPTRIGLVWAGLPARGEVFVRRALNRRSCPLTSFAPLADLPGITWYSLQVGPAAAELQQVDWPIRPFSPENPDFVASAERLADLDLLVSIDTAAAHLAGALNVPLWLLLAPGQNDYRWGQSGASPWYPNARLFRSHQTGWPPTIAAVIEALTQ